MAPVFERVIQSIEAELPPIPNFQTNQHTPQRIPQHYLSCLTFLLEDAAGNVTPITSREQSTQLFIEQQKRELIQTLGFSERHAEELAQQWVQEQSDDVDVE